MIRLKVRNQSKNKMNKEFYNLIHPPSFDEHEGHQVRGKRSNLHLISLRDFLFKYGEDLQMYYGEDFYTIDNEEKWASDNTRGMNSSSIILCMVDFSENITLSNQVKKSLRKAGQERRQRIKHRYSYDNPMNRIHGFTILTREHITKYPGKKVLSISVIATTPFSEKKGIGSDIMELTKNIASDCEYDDIILSVANDMAYHEPSSEEEDEYSDSSEEDEDDEDEEDDEGDDIEDYWYPDEGVMEVLSHELWRKTMRKPDGGSPYYNIDKDYIYELLEDYMFFVKGEEKDWNNEIKVGGGRTSFEEKELCSSIPEEPNENDYGGYFYMKGKRSQGRLVGFYEKFGFTEDASIFLDWDCCDNNPFPTMRLNLNNYTNKRLLE